MKKKSNAYICDHFDRESQIKIGIMISYKHKKV